MEGAEGSERGGQMKNSQVVLVCGCFLMAQPGVVSYLGAFLVGIGFRLMFYEAAK